MTVDARERFPGAPPGSYVTDEGWLVYEDEAWTVDEWRNPHRRPGRPRQPDPAAEPTEQQLRRRQQWRESSRRKYARRRGAA